MMIVINMRKSICDTFWRRKAAVALYQSSLLWFAKQPRYVMPTVSVKDFVNYGVGSSGLFVSRNSETREVTSVVLLSQASADKDMGFFSSIVYAMDSFSNSVGGVTLQEGIALMACLTLLCNTELFLQPLTSGDLRNIWHKRQEVVGGPAGLLISLVVARNGGINYGRFTRRFQPFCNTEDFDMGPFLDMVDSMTLHCQRSYNADHSDKSREKLEKLYDEANSAIRRHISSSKSKDYSLSTQHFLRGIIWCRWLHPIGLLTESRVCGATTTAKKQQAQLEPQGSGKQGRGNLKDQRKRRQEQLSLVFSEELEVPKFSVQSIVENVQCEMSRQRPAKDLYVPGQFYLKLSMRNNELSPRCYRPRWDQRNNAFTVAEDVEYTGVPLASNPCSSHGMLRGRIPLRLSDPEMKRDTQSHLQGPDLNPSKLLAIKRAMAEYDARDRRCRYHNLCYFVQQHLDQPNPPVSAADTEAALAIKAWNEQTDPKVAQAMEARGIRSGENHCLAIAKPSPSSSAKATKATKATTHLITPVKATSSHARKPAPDVSSQRKTAPAAAINFHSDAAELVPSPTTGEANLFDLLKEAEIGELDIADGFQDEVADGLVAELAETVAEEEEAAVKGTLLPLSAPTWKRQVHWDHRPDGRRLFGIDEPPVAVQSCQMQVEVMDVETGTLGMEEVLGAVVHDVETGREEVRPMPRARRRKRKRSTPVNVMVPARLADLPGVVVDGNERKLNWHPDNLERIGEIEVLGRPELDLDHSLIFDTKERFDRFAGSSHRLFEGSRDLFELTSNPTKSIQTLYDETLLAINAGRLRRGKDILTNSLSNNDFHYNEAFWRDDKSAQKSVYQCIYKLVGNRQTFHEVGKCRFRDKLASLLKGIKSTAPPQPNSATAPKSKWYFLTKDLAQRYLLLCIMLTSPSEYFVGLVTRSRSEFISCLKKANGILAGRANPLDRDPRGAFVLPYVPQNGKSDPMPFFYVVGDRNENRTQMNQSQNQMARATHNFSIVITDLEYHHKHYTGGPDGKPLKKITTKDGKGQALYIRPLHYQPEPEIIPAPRAFIL